MLDLLPPQPTMLDRGSARRSSRRATTGTVLVCCALGFQRSATAVADWLVATGRARHAAAGAKIACAHRAGRCIFTSRAVDEPA